MEPGRLQNEGHVNTADARKTDLLEAGRWSAGVAALGYVEPAEYGCTMCRRGPTRYFRFLTVDEHVWYAGSGFAGHLCLHCSIGMGRAYQVQTVARPWRSLLALPIAALMMISNAITLRAGRAPLLPPQPGHPTADRILAGVPVWRRPVFLGATALAVGVMVAVAPGIVM
jgi:hypothetical protein